MGRDLEGKGRDVIWGTILEFVKGMLLRSDSPYYQGWHALEFLVAERNLFVYTERNVFVYTERNFFIYAERKSFVYGI